MDPNCTGDATSYTFRNGFTLKIRIKKKEKRKSQNVSHLMSMTSPVV